MNHRLRISVGAGSFLDAYPDRWDEGFPFPQLGFTYGWETLPFGINGGYCYAPVDFRFRVRMAPKMGSSLRWNDEPEATLP